MSKKKAAKKEPVSRQRVYSLIAGLVLSALLFIKLGLLTSNAVCTHSCIEVPWIDTMVGVLLVAALLAFAFLTINRILMMKVALTYTCVFSAAWIGIVVVTQLSVM